MKNISGLLIKLEKDALGNRQNGTDYLIGYFDRLSIQPVDRWLSFSPKFTAPHSEAKNDSFRPVSFYPIKLLFPNKTTIKYLQERGWDYESWQDEEFDIFKNSPCITVALVNLTDTFKGKSPRDTVEAQLLRFIEAIEDGTFYLHGKEVSFSFSEFKKAHCCILPSIGYSDYCILLAEETWTLAPALMEYLHQAKNEEGPVLSTDYIMPVYHASNHYGEPNAISSNENSMRMSVRINLRPGVSMDNLKCRLNGVADVYHITGSGDCLIKSRNEKSFNEILQLLMPMHSSGTDMLENIVMDTETLLEWPVNLADSCEANGIARSTVTSCCIDQFREILRDYEGLLTTENRHMRQLNALHEHITSLENICGESHNISLQYIVAQWLPAVSNSLSRCISQIKNARSKNETAKVIELWSKTEDALERFNSQAGSFMADLSRSDNFFMESERYNHTSVSSATALIIAYNHWQNEFAEAVMKNAGVGNSKYRFLVRSGGCDSTNTSKLFGFLEPELKDGYLEEKLPFIIQMSEMSLFDCGGTVFRMTHECMHFCGNRHRRERVRYIFQFTARFFSKQISQALFNKDAFGGKLSQSLRIVYGVNDTLLLDQINQLAEQHSMKLAERISQVIASELVVGFMHDNSKGDEISLMSVKIRDWMTQKLYSMFSCYDDKCYFNQLASAMYQCQIEEAKDFYDDCNVILKSIETTSDLCICALESRRLYQYLRKDSEKKRDYNLESWIVLVLSQFMIDFSPGMAGSTANNIQLQKLRGCNVSRVVNDVIIDCFSEAFADLEACMRLDASIADYLLGFVFENWNLDTALPLTGPYICRIPPVLKLCYSEYLKDNMLADNAKEELRKAVYCLKEHGMPENRISVEALSARINALLHEYDNYKWEAEPLEKYLSHCKAEYLSSTDDKKEMERFSSAFRGIRLLAKDSDGDTITKIVTSLSQIKEVN